jgi:uncharacterized phage protein gp47/JayE
MSIIPDYLSEQSEKSIRDRMFQNLPTDLDKTEGSYIWDALSPAAIELAQAAIWAQEVLRRGFAGTTFGPYLDLRCAEHGVIRRSAVEAISKVKFIGTVGVIIPKGTRVATPADPNTNTPSLEFQTTSEITLVLDSNSGNGTGYAGIKAVEPGSSGNVPGGSINVLVLPVSGVSSVINEAATTGGLDIEEDSLLFARFLQKVRSTSAGGNKADYINWTMEVPGVGGVTVVPVRDGPGTVSIAILKNDKGPANQELVDEVQKYIAPPWINDFQAEDMPREGNGVTKDETLVDDLYHSVKMVYDPNLSGAITHLLTPDSDLPVLQQPGIWQARVTVKVDNSNNTANLLQIGVWNLSTGAWAKTTLNGTQDAAVIFKASELATVFSEKNMEFYWNGRDLIEFRAARLAEDQTSILWVDRVQYRSTFSMDTGDGKAPVGAKVTVQSAKAILVNVSANIKIAAGYNNDSVKAAVIQNIETYIKSLAFVDDNDVRYARICNAILDAPGIEDYNEPKVNGGTSNIPVGMQEVAVLGVVTLTCYQ